MGSWWSYLVTTSTYIKTSLFVAFLSISSVSSISSSFSVLFRYRVMDILALTFRRPNEYHLLHTVRSHKSKLNSLTARYNLKSSRWQYLNSHKLLLHTISLEAARRSVMARRPDENIFSVIHESWSRNDSDIDSSLSHTFQDRGQSIKMEVPSCCIIQSFIGVYANNVYSAGTRKCIFLVLFWCFSFVINHTEQ